MSEARPALAQPQQPPADRAGSPAVAAFRLILLNLVTRARVLGLGALGLIAIVLGVALRFNPGDDPSKTASNLIVDGYCLSLLVPVTALVFAAAALGDLAEDGTLVYLWLKPVARWKLVAAAFAATLCIALPVAVVPTTLAAAISDTGSALTGGALAGTALATLGYVAVFLGLGLLVRRALAWGLAYILIWEGAVSRVARGAARLSIQVYARSLFSHLGDRPDPKFSAALSTSLIAVIAAAAAALALTVYLLARDEVP
jgi:ABC-2 type transport system permease protein